jgi:hypothetical protein
MKRVKAASSSEHMLATAFTGVGGKKTLILMNRSSVEQKVG